MTYVMMVAYRLLARVSVRREYKFRKFGCMSVRRDTDFGHVYQQPQNYLDIFNHRVKLNHPSQSYMYTDTLGGYQSASERRDEAACSTCEHIGLQEATYPAILLVGPDYIPRVRLHLRLPINVIPKWKIHSVIHRSAACRLWMKPQRNILTWAKSTWLIGREG